MLLVTSQGMMGGPGTVVEHRSAAQLSDLVRRSPMPEHTVDGAPCAVNSTFTRSCSKCGALIRHTRLNNRNKAAALRISYVGHDGAARTYTADFLVDGSTLVEIKPKKLHATPTVLLKRAAAEAFCAAAGLTYELVDQPPLTDAEVASLRDSGAIKFTDRYEQKYLERSTQCHG
jgi:hypothetical protein